MDCLDGSLCRVTSSAKETSNQTLIVKVPDEDLSKFNYYPYKLIAIGANINNCEPSSSDKSDEEDEESKKFKLYLKSLEKDEKSDSGKITEPNNNTNKGTSTDSHQKKQHFRESKGSNYSRLNQRRRIYNTSQEGRSYNGSSTGNNYHNSSLNVSGSSDIDPWLNPIPMETLQSGFQYSSFNNFVNPLDSRISVNTNCEANSASSLLQNPPYTPMPHQFHSPNQSHAFVPGQNYWNSEYHSSDYQNDYASDYQNDYIYPPGNSNTFQRSVSSGNSQNYQRSVSSGNSQNYQRSGLPDRPVSGRQDRRSNFRNGKKFWRNKSGKKFDRWKRNQNEKKRRGDGSSGYYSYDYRN